MADTGFAVAREGVKWHWRLIAWLYRRCFKIPPTWWVAITMGSGGIAAVGATQSLPELIGILATSLPGAVAVGGMAALFGWSRMARQSERLVVFFSPFNEKSADTTRVASLQVEALREMVHEDPLLSDRVEVRTLRVPLCTKSSARLLQWTEGRLCVSGEVVTAAGQTRWAPWLAVRWTWSTGVSTRRRFYMSRPHLHPASPEKMEVDAGVPLVVFTEKNFSTMHARGVRAALLMLVAGEVLHRDTAASKACREAAKQDADALPVLLRALLLILDTDASDAPSLGDWAKQRAQAIASRAAGTGADHPYLWKEVASLMAMSEREDYSRPSERLPFARRAAASAPSDLRAAFGAGAALVATAEEQVLEHADIDGARELCTEAVPHLEKAQKCRERWIRREAKDFLRAAKEGAEEPKRVWSAAS